MQIDVEIKGKTCLFYLYTRPHPSASHEAKMLHGFQKKIAKTPLAIDGLNISARVLKYDDKTLQPPTGQASSYTDISATTSPHSSNGWLNID
jgi:hypothetical protein